MSENKRSYFRQSTFGLDYQCSLILKGVAGSVSAGEVAKVVDRCGLLRRGHFRKKKRRQGPFIGLCWIPNWKRSIRIFDKNRHPWPRLGLQLFMDEYLREISRFAVKLRHLIG